MCFYFLKIRKGAQTGATRQIPASQMQHRSADRQIAVAVLLAPYVRQCMIIMERIGLWLRLCLRAVALLHQLAMIISALLRTEYRLCVVGVSSNFMGLAERDWDLVPSKENLMSMTRVVGPGSGLNLCC